MGEGKEGEGSTVCEEDDDGAVISLAEDGTTVRCGVTTNSQTEDWDKKGEETVVCSISSGFFAFCSFFVSSGVLVVSWHLFRLAFLSSWLILFLFPVSVSCGAILVFGEC